MLALRPWQVAEPQQVNQLKSSEKRWLVDPNPRFSHYIPIYLHIMAGVPNKTQRIAEFPLISHEHVIQLAI
jgi:hypothetical protein